ncbi:MAG: hypothetical protein RBR22_11795 [Desulfuromonas sp.]|jgi:hypothetical protein|nr:hypothetical protein [Atribacterota bacterium]MDY0191405.1 hypothetical protein [Desulfuromonas sp.]
MPIHFDYPFRKINSEAEITQLNCGNDTLLAWWYCGIYKNAREQSQPLVQVAFRTQISAKVFSNEIVYRNISIALLGQIRIGSLCRDNRVIAHATYETREFDLLFEKGGWWFTSFDKTTELNRQPPFPLEIYPLISERDKNWLVEFRLESGGTLISPCLEYFNRCYGQSAELRRILTTYPWKGREGSLDRLFAPLGEPEESNKIWKIKLRESLYKGDATFLAHVKYDDYARRAAKFLHSNLETQYSGSTSIPAFAKIGPWHTGHTRLRVGGISFNDGKSFLGLQILGGTEPVGMSIILNREHSENSLNSTGQVAGNNTSQEAPLTKLNQRAESLNLTAFSEPDNNGYSIELDDPEFVILGPRRAVYTHRTLQARSAGRLSTSGEDNGIDTYSAGDPYGNGKGVGQASLKIKIVLESEGVLRDMWNAMLHLKKQYPNTVHSVEWYSPSQGFTQSETPELVALSPIDANEFYEGKRVETSIRTWPYMDKTTQKELRGLLIARININGTDIYIIEIQRRPRKRKNSSGKSINTEEPFRGLVFRVDSQEALYSWLSVVMSQVRYLKGVVSKLTKYCPGKVDTFVHVESSRDEVACWSTLENALNKMSITFK